VVDIYASRLFVVVTFQLNPILSLYFRNTILFAGVKYGI
jgi:hypothetical protein